MAALAHNKYVLKSLHEEIDLFDRKLAHMLKYEVFPTDAARKTSAGKLQLKRDLLARSARQLASEGVEFSPSDLPRSFREASAAPTEAPADGALLPQEEPLLTTQDTSVGEAQVTPIRSFPSPFAGTVLDSQGQVEAYKRGRAKLPVAH